MVDVTAALESLAVKRPIYHSEADFQHALAWQLQVLYPNAAIRLEYRPPYVANRIYIDIWLELAGIKLAIELKYKTRKLETQFRGERFTLLNQSAQDIARYDFIKDICRLENVTKSDPVVIGVAILLTNDPTYWRETSRNGTVDQNFRLHEGRNLQGSLPWLDHASAGTMKGRERPLCLLEDYSVNWRSYSDLGENQYGTFRALAISVTPRTKSRAPS